MNSDIKFWISAAIVVMALLAVIVVPDQINQHHKTSLKSQDLQAAIAKGVDPIAIRCAYADSNDSMCLVYAAGIRDKQVSMTR